MCNAGGSAPHNLIPRLYPQSHVSDFGIQNVEVGNSRLPWHPRLSFKRSLGGAPWIPGSSPGMTVVLEPIPAPKTGSKRSVSKPTPTTRSARDQRPVIQIEDHAH